MRRNIIKGFTLIELLVVISIISLLSSIVLSSLTSARERARDAQRFAQIRQLQIALDMYYDSNGRYPDADFAGCGGWDTPGNGTFLNDLVSTGFLRQHLSDPQSGKDGTCGNYRYYRYPANYEGCTNPFYVIEIIDLERVSGPAPSSPGWSCPTRIWSGEGEWVAGKFE